MSDVGASQAVSVGKDFVGLISHELRTPLSSIIGYLELMRDEDEPALSANQKHYLGVAERNAHTLLRLVGDLLFAAQVESGYFQLDEGRADLGAIIAASVESARPGAVTAGVALVSSVDAQLTITGDPVRLGQAVDNLLSNAIKYTPRGGRVTIALDRSGANAVVTVHDTGVGIAATELDRLGSRFFRATTATQSSVPGIGLGLTITKAIVIAHGGELSIESEEGAGTRFTMSFPLG